jgi:hypothetical protein
MSARDAAIGLAKGVEVQHQHGTGPVDRTGQQQANHQRAGEIAFRLLKLRGQMGKGFQTDKHQNITDKRGEKL